MENFLRKIKLIDDFSTTLKTTKTEFTSALRNHVDEGDIDGMFSGFFEAFTSSNNKFKGLVSSNDFKIRKRRRFFEKNFGKAIATGNLREQGDTLVINTKINAWHNFMFFFFGFITLIYLLFFGVFLSQVFSFDDGLSFVAPLFILFHALLMYGIPYFIMRRGVKRMKQDLEREFHFILSKPNGLK